MDASLATEPARAPAVPAERKQVTILFADFSGFTAFAEHLDPEDVRDCMQSIWKKVDAIITAHGGTPEKHSGDAVMAVFGGGKAREEDPAEAVRAAMEIQAWLRGRIEMDSRLPMQLRIGIHTGLAVVGPANPHGEFLATGDTVNLASRLEQNAPTGGILISGDTLRHVFGFFDTQSLPPLTVKGKIEPVDAYLVIRTKPRGVALQMRGIAGIETAMVGRRGELSRLQTAFRVMTSQRQPQLLTVVAEGGLGKSRLIRELQKWMELEPQYIRLFSARATAEISGVPFALIRDLFSVRFEILESDPAVVARQKFQRGLEEMLMLKGEKAGWSQAELMSHISFIGQLLGFDFSNAPPLNDLLSDGAQLRQQGFRGFRWLLKSLCQCTVAVGTPAVSGIVMLVEDLHWADRESLELFEYLIRDGAETPLMIVGTTRPALLEARPDWGQDWLGSVQLDLAPLSQAESEELMGDILRKAERVPLALQELITEGAEGNPFYIEEMVRMLMDQKVIVPTTEPWEVNLEALANARIPSTLTGVLQARLDNLMPAERLVLQRASVIGRVFWDTAVAVMGSPEVDAGQDLFLGGQLKGVELAQALEGLRRKELVHRREASAFAGAGEFIIKHELLRNVAYESLLKKSRRRYHGQVAAWLERQSGDRSNEFAVLIATHYEQAAQGATAAEWFGRAGQRAWLGYAPAIASAHFTKALQLVSQAGPDGAASQARQLEWREGLGETLAAQARFAEALEAYTAMRDCARKQEDLLAEARAWNGLAYVQERRGENRLSIQCAEQARTLAAKAPQRGVPEIIRALYLKGWATYRLGDAAAVLALGNETLKLCTDNSDHRGIAVSYKLLGVAQLQLGHYAEADALFERGRGLFQALNDQRNTAAMWSNRGETARATGDYQTSAIYYEQALAIARQIGHRESELVYLANLSGAWLELGQFQRAEADLRQVIRQTLGQNSCVLSEAYSFLSLACLAQGNFAEACAAAQRAVGLARESESALYLGIAWRAWGQIGAECAARNFKPCQELDAGDMLASDPVHCFSESLRIFEDIAALGEEARTLRAWGDYELRAGSVAKAMEKLSKARDIFHGLGASHEVTLTNALFAGVTKSEPRAV